MRQIWVGCILLSTAVSGSAVTLGRHFGAAVIGRPLDVRVQMFLAPGEDMGSLCIGSDVFYGDSQVPASQVRSTPQKSATEAEGYVRVQSLQAVNEPIVTVYVRASCTAPFTRRFVLLADPITEPSALAVPSPIPETENRRVDDARAAPERPPPVNPPSVASAPEQPVAKPEQPVVRPPKPASVVRRPAAPAPKPTSRLQLEPLDLGPAMELDPVLKMSISLLSGPTSSDETRAAAALLWKTINASPEAILGDAQKLSALESESKSLRDAAAQSQAAMAELRSNLAAAQAEKYMNGLVYLLGSALLLALLALGVLWRRRDPVSANDDAKIWWASEINPKTETVLRKAAPTPVDVKLELGPDPTPSLKSDKREAGLSKGRLSVLDSGFPFSDSAPGQPLPDKDKRDFVHSSTTGASRSVATEELFDVQQKADFFLSLGKDEEAIQVLLSHLNENQEPCALTYLDLLNIYHRLGRTADYERLRKEFNQVFNAGVPPFEQYSDASQGLDAYESAFGRIQALWPQPRVLDVIEQSIFRDPYAATAEVFDLEAYRELLLLHAIAKDIIKRDVESPSALMDFPHTAVQPLKVKPKVQPKATRSFAAAAGPSKEPFEMERPASPRLGLDIDLNELLEDPSFAVLSPEDDPSVPPTTHAHLETLPRAVRSAPLRDPNPSQGFDFVMEEPDLPPRNVTAKTPSK
ncbi:MAG: hypothetical protein U1A81_12290 [Hydrogenophaga sp.]|nr:hypothetical protein [Hydrogenophaga sp.]